MQMEVVPSMDEKFLSLINQIIEDQLGNEHFSVEDLAQKAGLSRSMLHRKLIKLTGKSATDLIMDKRLTRAKDLLDNDVATVSEIAYKVGFNSTSYFHRAFKKRFKLSPGDIKKKIITDQFKQTDEMKTEIKKSYKSKFSRYRIVTLLILLTIIVTASILYFVLEEKEPPEKSIAILPFDNLSTESENQFFADGIAEDLLYRLSAISELKVISRTSSEIFRSKGNRTVPEIADLLGVNYILEGTVQRHANNVRITIQLIDAKHDNHILSRQYDRELNEVFRIQTELASEITSELSLALTERQLDLLKQTHTDNLKAFEYKQLGRYYLNQRSRKDVSVSINYFRRAINEDPDYALAYAEIADAYFISSWYGYIDRQTGRDSAEYLALKALEMDNNIGEAHTVLAIIYNEYDWNYRDSEKEYLQAIQISPNHATTYQYYAEYLNTNNRIDEARKMMNKAVELDPYSVMIRLVNSIVYFQEKKYQQALTEIALSQELAKNPIGAISKELSIHIMSGDSLSTLNTYKKLGLLTGEWTPDLADSLFHSNGIKGLIKYRIQLGNWSYFIIEAHYYTFLGDKESALDFLERALDEGNLAPTNTADFEFEDLRSEPRFIAIREKMGLPPLK